MKKTPVKILIILLALTFSLFVFMSYTNFYTDVFGFKFQGTEVPIWHVILTFIATVFGVIFSIIVSRTGENLEKLGWKDFLQLLLQVTTPGALIIASLVYVFAFHTVYKMAGDWVAYFAAFQSGFFFKEVMAALIAGKKPKSE